MIVCYQSPEYGKFYINLTFNETFGVTLYPLNKWSVTQCWLIRCVYIIYNQQIKYESESMLKAVSVVFTHTQYRNAFFDKNENKRIFSKHAYIIHKTFYRLYAKDRSYTSDKRNMVWIFCQPQTLCCSIDFSSKCI